KKHSSPGIYASQESAGDAVRKQFKISGPGGNYTAACATGIVSLHAGMMYLKSGEADYCIVGSAESSLNSFYTAGFKRMGVYAEISGAPSKALKPFSIDRSGFLPAEGAGVLIIEKSSSAIQRGAHIYGTVDACVIGNDGYDPVFFNSNGKNIARVIHEAVIRAKWELHQVDYINAHGTGTKLNDYLEASALTRVFGGRKINLSVSSTKAGTGHLLGAAGSVETGFALLAMRDGIVPPTLNLIKKDPAWDLDFTGLYARRKKIHRVMSLSYGFGGHIGAVSLARWGDT
ncbi:MAG: beta-ketoacyl synthase N-terminal-like domain-containing protein, partial [bacterium]